MAFDRQTYRLLLMCCMLPSVSLAQQEESLIEEQIIEQIIEDVEADVDLSEFTERLRYHLRHPLDLNSASEEDLAVLVFLSLLQVSNIVKHREVAGKYISILELQGVDGLDLQTIQLMEPFVQVRAEADWSDFTMRSMIHESEYEFMVRYGRVLQQQRGYAIEDADRSRYMGSPDRITNRIRMNYDNRIRLSVNMDKDAGEPFFAEKQKYGFDFYSASLEIRGGDKFQKLIVGDYALQFGQGLVVWNGLSFGKGAWIGSVAKQGIGLKQYTSLNENRFLRGVSTVVAVKNWSFTPFLSWNKLTGSVSESEDGRVISSINYSGYHRTPTELAKRKNIDQYVYGMNATYQWKRLKLGGTILRTHLDGAYVPADLLRNRFSFSGKELTNVGIHYQYTYRNLFLYGETAHSLGSGIATVNGVVASFSPKISGVVNYRYYQRDYHHFFAQSMGEQSSVGNEKGVYAGIVYHPSRKIEWTNYLDIFHFPWLRFGVDAPSSGMDVFSQLSYIWYKKGQLSVRYRQRLKQENSAALSSSSNILADVWRNQGRIDFQYKLNDRWSIRSRAEMTYYYKEYEPYQYGYMAFQDVIWRKSDNRFGGNLRLAYFRTDAYDSRIYAYEQDVLYGAGFPTYYGTGIRGYVNVRARLGRKLEVWGRYAMTRYENVDEVGSQLDLIEGAVRSDFRIQLRYRIR